MVTLALVLISQLSSSFCDRNTARVNATHLTPTLTYVSFVRNVKLELAGFIYDFDNVISRLFTVSIEPTWLFLVKYFFLQGLSPSPSEMKRILSSYLAGKILLPKRFN